MGEFAGEPLYHGSLASAEYREMLTRLGFAVLEHRVRDSECGALTLWLARLTGGPGGSGSGDTRRRS
jgi:hypothetical protein